MEEYINNETIIKNEIFKVLGNSIICNICKNILISPVMCMKCQKEFCKKCIEKEAQCLDCGESDFQNCLGKQEILSKLSFKCKKCGKTYFYNDADKHDCSDNQNPNSKFTKLSSTEIEELTKQGNELTYITSKKKNY